MFKLINHLKLNQKSKLNLYLKFKVQEYLGNGIQKCINVKK